MVSNGEQEKESIIRVRVGKKNPSLWITNCQHSARLVIPNGDLRDGYFYPILTLMIDSFILPFSLEFLIILKGNDPESSIFYEPVIL